MNVKDISGNKYGKLTAISVISKDYYGHNYLCKCDCGKEVIIRSAKLRNGHTKSCGCHKSKITTERNYVHGLTKTRLYRIWGLMKNRCNNKNTRDYKNYGARGIMALITSALTKLETPENRRLLLLLRCFCIIA